jgi:signal transduction histidine kinase
LERDESEKDWIAEASHELRLPIANIKLLVDTLLDGALEDPATAKRMLERAQGEVTRLELLVKDLLSIGELDSRPRQGGLARQRSLLTERVLDAFQTTQAFAKERKVELVNQAPQEMFVYANLQQLDQVLINLIENAIKFTPAGGQVTVGSESASSFFVQDTGIGMAVSELPRIFQRFYRIDRASTKGSTGLGLSIVKDIVELHGAKITVTSQQGSGSKFTLEFPDEK